MTRARRELVDFETTAYYHYIFLHVRRAHLCAGEGKKSTQLLFAIFRLPCLYSAR